MSARRALHFVFKVGDREAAARFYKDILGMKVLRHEEFSEGCDATCNGPYDGKWSKTMIGYGPEDSHFVLELTYNYGIKNYEKGNDFIGLTIKSREAIEKAKKHGWPMKEETSGLHVLEAPGGYTFNLLNESQPKNLDPVQKITLATSDLSRSLAYWRDLCFMNVYYNASKHAVMGYADNQCKLELENIEQPIDHAAAFGRIAFSCQSSELPIIETTMKESKQTIITPFISLETPGKATVQVVILADPDGHEICFVGDEGFRELSQVDPNASELLDVALEADRSDEWFAKKGKGKSEA